MSTEEPHVEAPVEPPSATAAPPSAPAEVEVAAPAPRGPSTNVILIGVAVVAALVFGGFYLAQHPNWFGGASSTAVNYQVQPYAPAQAMMTATERVAAHARPDLASPTVVVFGQGVALTITGRVSRGLGDEWFAISWNNEQAFVRAADAVAGDGTPPPPAEHQRQEPRVRPPEAQEDVAGDDFPPIPDAPSSSLGGEIRDPDWIRAPSARDFARYYPDRALEQGRSGRVVLDCVAQASGRLDCSVASEDPGGYGFGRAAMSIARQVRLQPTQSDGRSVAGGHLTLPLNFRAG